MMMATLDSVMGRLLDDRNWVPVLDMGGSRFEQSTAFPEMYRRTWVEDLGAYPDGDMRRRVEHTRLACDDVVVHTYVEAAERLLANG